MASVSASTSARSRAALGPESEWRMPTLMVSDDAPFACPKTYPLVASDAALAIAKHISGSTDAFVALMNQRAAEAGLVNTHFANPHGLDATGHYTSAYDLAVLTRLAMQRQDFRTIVNTKYRVVTGSMATYDLGTLNPLYGRLAGVDGVKTGFKS